MVGNVGLDDDKEYLSVESQRPTLSPRDRFQLSMKVNIPVTDEFEAIHQSDLLGYLT